MLHTTLLVGKNVALEEVRVDAKGSQKRFVFMHVAGRVQQAVAPVLKGRGATYLSMFLFKKKLSANISAKVKIITFNFSIMCFWLM